MTNLYTKLYLKKDGNQLLVLFALGVVMLVSSIFFFFSRERLRLSSKSKERDIGLVILSNISPSQVSVIWETKQQVSTYIVYGESPDSLNYEAKDELVLENGSFSRYHYATLRGLDSNKTYYFAVKVGNKLIGKGEVPFNFKTPPKFLPSNKDPLVGKILDSKGQPVKGKVVLLTIEGVFPLSSITGEKGEWVIPLGLVFDSQAKKKVEFSGNEKFSFTVLGENLSVQGYLSEFLEYSFPLIIGKEYYFEKAVRKSRGAVERDKNGRGFKVILTYPKQGATISNARPLIKGKGVPYEEVLVEIESKKRIVLKTTVDENGDWQVSLPFKLSPGRHIINVFTKDSQGKLVEIVRDFYIGKSGESVLSAATPSASLTTTPEPTPTTPPTPTPTKAIVSTSTPTPPVSGFDPNIIFALSIFFLIPGVLLLLK